MFTAALSVLMGSISVGASVQSEQNHKVMIVGDLQSASMYNAVGGAGCTWFIDQDADYEWVNTTLAQIDQEIDANTSVIFLLGADADEDSVAQYAELLNAKASAWESLGADTYYASISSHCGANVTRKNTEEISIWNTLMLHALTDSVTYIDSDAAIGLGSENVSSSVFYKTWFESLVGSAGGAEILASLSSEVYAPVEGVSGYGTLQEDGAVDGVSGSNPGGEVAGVSGSGTLNLFDDTITVISDPQELIQQEDIAQKEENEEAAEVSYEDNVLMSADDLGQPVEEDTHVPGVVGSNDADDYFGALLESKEDIPTEETIDQEVISSSGEMPKTDPVIFDEEDVLDTDSSEERSAEAVMDYLNETSEEASSESDETDSLVEKMEETAIEHVRRGTVADTEAKEATPENTGWTETEEGRQFYTDDGTLAVGREQIDGTWYFFNEEGILAEEGIYETDEGILCVESDGSIAKGWKSIEEVTYYFLDNGYAATGRVEIGGNSYFFTEDGVLLTGKFEMDGVMYFSNEEGQLQLGWIEWNGATYYGTENGLVIGDTVIEEKVYSFDEHGVLMTSEFSEEENSEWNLGWNETNAGKVYYREDGTKLTGWKKIQGETYFFNESGFAVSGRQQIDGLYFQFGDDGVLQGGLSGATYSLEETDDLDTQLRRESLSGDEEKEIQVSYVSCSRGDAFDSSKVQVVLIDDTGVGTLLTAYTVGDEVSNPTTIDGDLMIMVETIYGKTELLIHPEAVVREEEIEEERDVTVLYDGVIYEGDRPRASLIQAFVEQEDGTKEAVSITHVEGDLDSPLLEEQEIQIETEEGSYSLVLTPIAVSYIEPDVTGVKRLGDSIDPENVVIGYEDGTFRKVPITECEFGIQPSEKILGEGENEFPLLWKGKEYVMTITALEALEEEETIDTSTITGSGTGVFAPDDLTGLVLEDLGTWRLTGYADVPEDQGIYVGKTASGAALVAGRTVAVSAATMKRRGLQFGDRIVVNGHIYTIEDTGDSYMENRDWVDIFVGTDRSLDSSDFCNGWSQVYLVK